MLFVPKTAQLWNLVWYDKGTWKAEGDWGSQGILGNYSFLWWRDTISDYTVHSFFDYLM